MAPRSSTLPAASTDSARQARQTFFCDLCQKGYARMPEFEAHENSYDHQHRKRLKEMRQITKDPSAAARQRAAEGKANVASGLKSIALPQAEGNSGSGKKKPVFKSTLQSSKPVEVEVEAQPSFPLLDDLSNAAANPELDERERRRRAMESYRDLILQPLQSREEYERDMARVREEQKADGSYPMLQKLRKLKVERCVLELLSHDYKTPPKPTAQQIAEYEKREAEDLAFYGDV